MCLGGHLVSHILCPLSLLPLCLTPDGFPFIAPCLTGFPGKPCALGCRNSPPVQFTNVLQAAFDPRILSAVCFFATDIHGATLGKGGDDSLALVQAGVLTGKGELVVWVMSPVLTHVTGLNR